jgi:hypothetical protein
MFTCLPSRLSPRVLAALAGVAAVTVVLAGAADTNAADRAKPDGGPKTVRTTLNIPAMVVDNLCNGDVVAVSGDLKIVTTTTPHRDGGYTVRSRATARNLRGERIAPPPPVGYHAHDGQDSYSYYAPPPQPSQHRVVHWTRLIPEADQPVMYLVFEIQETVLADGTVVPVLDRMYLHCSPPADRSWSR